MNKEIVLLYLLVCLSLLLLLVNLNFPSNFYFDENYTAFTAQQLAKKNTPEIWNPSLSPIDPPRGYEWTHPPFARLCIAAAIKILGNKPWVWRFPSVLSGSLSLLLTYALGKHFFSKTTALIAVFLVAFDGLHFAASRIATLDSLLVCLCLLSLYFAYRNLPLSAITLGMAIATKWIALVLMPLLILICYCKNPKIPLSRSLLLLSLIPCSVYLLSYLPFFTAGLNFSDFISLQKTMFLHTFSINKIHPFASPWYFWPLGLKPIPYFTQAGKELWAIPNPIVFWVGLAAIFSLFAKAKQKLKLRGLKALKFIHWYQQKAHIPKAEILPKRDLHSPPRLKKPRFPCEGGLNKSSLLILAAYLVFLLPWIIYPIFFPKRPTFLYYYLPSLPFLCLFTANWLSEFLRKKSKPARAFAITILAVTPLTFFALYPRLAGL